MTNLKIRFNSISELINYFKNRSLMKIKIAPFSDKRCAYKEIQLYLKDNRHKDGIRCFSGNSKVSYFVRRDIMTGNELELR